MTDSRYWQEGDRDHIDVSKMEPPGPYVTILRWLESPECGTEVVVHFSRDPIYLFPELTERNWRWTYLKNTPGDVVLHLEACDN